MITFALDTATVSPSVAVVRDDAPLAELFLGTEPGAGRRVLEAGHGALLAVGLSADDVDAVVVGVGPGGFTGLRIGLATALGLGQALGVPVHGAVSLEALALGVHRAAPEHDLVVPVIDARRRELFAAAYRPLQGGGLHEVIPPTAIAPAELAARVAASGRDAVAGGPGLAAAGTAFADAGVATLPIGSPANVIRAALLVARVADGADRPARPVYARLPDAEVNRRAAAATAG